MGTTSFGLEALSLPFGQLLLGETLGSPRLTAGLPREFAFRKLEWDQPLPARPEPLVGGVPETMILLLDLLFAQDSMFSP